MRKVVRSTARWERLPWREAPLLYPLRAVLGRHARQLVARRVGAADGEGVIIAQTNFREPFLERENAAINGEI